MLRLLAIADLLLISLAYQITPIIENGLIHSDISTAPFVQIGKGLYYIEIHLQKNWFHAYETCRLIDAELVTFNTKDEWNAVTQYLNEMDNIQRTFWTSGTDLSGEGNHNWFSNGQAISADIWDKGEPNNTNNVEHCDNFTHWADNAYPMGLNDDQCTNKWYYICEAPQPKTVSFTVW